MHMYDEAAPCIFVVLSVPVSAGLAGGRVPSLSILGLASLATVVFGPGPEILRLFSLILESEMKTDPRL
jgi:hypothetical protein